MFFQGYVSCTHHPKCSYPYTYIYIYIHIYILWCFFVFSSKLCNPILPNKQPPVVQHGSASRGRSVCTSYGWRWPWNPTGTPRSVTLVGGLEHGFYDFPFSWECHHPIWRTHIFQRGGSTTNQLAMENHHVSIVWMGKSSKLILTRTVFL